MMSISSYAIVFATIWIATIVIVPACVDAYRINKLPSGDTIFAAYRVAFRIAAVAVGTAFIVDVTSRQLQLRPWPTVATAAISFTLAIGFLELIERREHTT